MVISPEDKKIREELKQPAKDYQICPYCKKKVMIGIEFITLQELTDNNAFPYAHIYLHGNPLHALLCYIDAHGSVRSMAVIKSIEISRDSDTFSQFIKKWANPF